MAVSVTRRIELPRLPNLVKFEGSHEYVAVETLSDQELQALGAEWQKALLEHAEKRRKQAKEALQTR